jgi:hypothetical protein
MKFYRLFLLILIILSSCGSVCAAEPVHPLPPTFYTHIDLNDKCGAQKVDIQKGKNLMIKAELWGEKSGTIFGHDEFLAHEKLIWFVFDINNHYKMISTNIRYTNMFGNSYQSFRTENLQKGKYGVTVNYFGGESYFLRDFYESSSAGIEIDVT